MLQKNRWRAFAWDSTFISTLVLRPDFSLGLNEANLRTLEERHYEFISDFLIFSKEFIIPCRYQIGNHKTKIQDDEQLDINRTITGITNQLEERQMKRSIENRISQTFLFPNISIEFKMKSFFYDANRKIGEGFIGPEFSCYNISEDKYDDDDDAHPSFPLSVSISPPSFNTAHAIGASISFTGYTDIWFDRTYKSVFKGTHELDNIELGRKNRKQLFDYLINIKRRYNPIRIEQQQPDIYLGSDQYRDFLDLG